MYMDLLRAVSCNISNRRTRMGSDGLGRTRMGSDGLGREGNSVMPGLYVTASAMYACAIPWVEASCTVLLSNAASADIGGSEIPCNLMALLHTMPTRKHYRDDYRLVGAMSTAPLDKYTNISAQSR
uniref:Uncharacterized protein n=1 Tax=Timema cristinae TaxID=61476 RepID=A0A7R9CM92_TIMCR|nr:unnamed protein product [Timema cristinae]